MRISLFIPCFIDQFYPRVATSMVTVLERLGHTVEYDERQTCCGQPAFNSGYWQEARSVAGRMLRHLLRCRVRGKCFRFVWGDVEGVLPGAFQVASQSEA